MFYRKMVMHSKVKQRMVNQMMHPIFVINGWLQEKIQTAATVVKTNPVMKIVTPRMTRATLRLLVLIVL